MQINRHAAWTTRIAGAVVIGSIEWLVGQVLNLASSTIANISLLDKLLWGIPIFLLFFSVFLLFSPAIERWINSLGGKKQKDEPDSDLQKKVEELTTEIKKLVPQSVEWGKLLDKQIEDTINKWATMPYCAVVPRPDDESRFSLAVIAPDGIPINIFSPKKHPDQVAFASMVDMNQVSQGKYKIAFNSLETASQVDLISKIRLEMVRLDGINFAGLKLPLETITLIMNIPLNDLSGEAYFRERISYIRKASVLLLTILQQHLVNAGKLTLQDLDKDAKTKTN